MAFKIPFFNRLLSKNDNTFYSLTTHNVVGLEGLNDLADFNGNDQQLIEESYGSNVTAYAIVKKITQCGANIPKILVDLDNPEDGPIEEGEVYNMLQRPAIYQGETLSQYDYFEALLTYLLTTGNTYQVGLTAAGFGDIWQQVELLPSGLTQPLAGNSYLSPVKGFQFNDKQGQTLGFLTEDVMHTKYINPTKVGLNDLKGLGPLEAAVYSLTGSNDINKAIALMVRNQGARGVLTNKSDKPLRPNEAKQLAAKLNTDYQGVKNFNKVNISNTDMSYLQIGMSANDLKIIESNVLTDRQLCNAYGVSSRLFNDPANSTYNNVLEATKGLYTEAVIPACNKLLEDINYSWLRQWSERDRKNYALQLDTSGIEALQSDQKLEAEKDKIKMDGVNVILNMPISTDAKAALLQSEYGYTVEDTTAILQTVGTPNATLETLKSLSPLLANKLLEKLTEEEVRQLLGK